MLEFKVGVWGWWWWVLCWLGFVVEVVVGGRFLGCIVLWWLEFDCSCWVCSLCVVFLRG